jgi:hypothetical protein
MSAGCDRRRLRLENLETRTTWLGLFLASGAPVSLPAYPAPHPPAPDFVSDKGPEVRTKRWHVYSPNWLLIQG